MDETNPTRENMDDALYALWTIVSNTEESAVKHSSYEHLAKSIHEVAISAIQNIGSTKEEFIRLMTPTNKEE